MMGDGDKPTPGNQWINDSAIIRSIRSSDPDVQRLFKGTDYISQGSPHKIVSGYFNEGKARSIYNIDLLIELLKVMKESRSWVLLQMKETEDDCFPLKLRTVGHDGEATTGVLSPMKMDVVDEDLLSQADWDHFFFDVRCGNCDWSDHYEDSDSVQEAIDDHRYFTGHDSFKIITPLGETVSEEDFE
jgi:hypothetical protein